MSIINNKKIIITGIIGIFIALGLSFLFHELYGLSNENFFVGLLFPVNESKWEHWKIVFWPILVVGIIEYFILKDEANNILFAKAIAILVAQIVTFGLIELYEAIFGSWGMWLHIISLILGITAGQLTSIYIMINIKPSTKLYLIGLAIILIEIAIFITFTLNPPRTEYFKDSIDGTYGIFKEIS
jgi:hypothetical protein